jgi:protein-S-isoprenylcysteine O-methyltransferase Ste14
MTAQPTVNPPDAKPVMTKAIVQRAIQLGITLLIIMASLFLSAGRLDWVMAWVYIGLYVGGIAINALLIDRELIAERSEIGQGTKNWDKPLASLSMLLFTPGALIVAGLDQRFGWSQLAPVVQFVALAGVVLGNVLISWAMVSNKFFATTVRIQKDRGHTVISTGPYRFVRHPGYLALSISGLATPLLLGSWWALLPSLLGICALTARTALEDRTLREELAGYQEYAKKVRYRLLPGIW